MTVLSKDPDSVLDYAFEWSSQLEDAEVIAMSEWSVEPIEDGGVKVDRTSIEETMAVAVISGGVAGDQYRLTNRVVTSLGRTYDRSLSFLCFER